VLGDDLGRAVAWRYVLAWLDNRREQVGTREAAADAAEVGTERLAPGMTGGTTGLDEDCLSAASIAAGPVNGGQPPLPGGDVHAVGVGDAGGAVGILALQPGGPRCDPAETLAGAAAQRLVDAVPKRVGGFFERLATKRQDKGKHLAGFR